MVNNTFSKTMTLFLSALLLVVFMAGCTSAAEPDLTGVTWRWTSLEESEPASVSVVPNPENYTLTFQDNGQLGLQIDCNSGGGSYEMDGSSLTIQLGASTLAYCGEESLDMQFTALLDEVDSFAVEDGSLVLLYGQGAGRMVFMP